MIIRQKISNHPVFGFDREVEITNITFNFVDKLIIIYFHLIHIDSQGKVIEHRDTKQPDYWVVDNSYEMVVRDAEMNPIPNPDFGKKEIQSVPIYSEEGDLIGDEEVEVIVDNEEFLKEPAFDVFIEMLQGYQTIVQNYILHDDENGRFNYFDKPEANNDLIEGNEGI